MAGWISFARGDSALTNSYGSILVDPAKLTVIKAADARTWHEWLTGPAAITAHRIEGEQIFIPTRR